MDIVQYIVLHPLSTKIFLMKLFKNFQEQEEDFLNISSDSLVKNSAIQLKSYQAIKLKYFKVINVGVIPQIWLSYFPVIQIHGENSSYSLKVHLRANCPTRHCKIRHVLSFMRFSNFFVLNFYLS